MNELKQRFRIKEYPNRTGSISYRVSGTKRDGTRIQENYADPKEAKLRHIELEGEYHKKESEVALRSTKLTDTQVRLAELAFVRLEDDEDILRAVDYWLKQGKQQHVSDSALLDDAVTKFTDWLDGKPDETGNGICTLRTPTRKNLRARVKVFSNSVKNFRVNEIRPDTVEDFIGKLNVSNTTRDNYRRGLSRFFSWCIQRPRRWTVVNPCREVRVEKEEKAPPTIFTNDECAELLKAAEGFKNGRLAPYVAVCLFGGLRPFEAARLQWSAVNLADGEIRLEGQQTKTGRPRVVTVCATLKAWLEAHEGKPFYPSNWRKDFAVLQEAIGYGPAEKIVRTKIPGIRKKKIERVKSDLEPWPEDVMRHTAISHYFRKTGSYGQTAEQFGNSEAIIKNHYQARVSSEEAKAFYALRPTNKKANGNSKKAKKGTK